VNTPARIPLKSFGCDEPAGPEISEIPMDLTVGNPIEQSNGFTSIPDKTFVILSAFFEGFWFFRDKSMLRGRIWAEESVG
jgi:hypothetical protein